MKTLTLALVSVGLGVLSVVSRTAAAGAPVAAGDGGTIEFPAQIHFQMKESPEVRRGQPWHVRVSATSPARVERVLFSFAVAGAPRFQTRRMQQVGAFEYELVVPGIDTETEAISYFFTAFDASGNGASELGSADSPLTLRLEPAGSRNPLLAALATAALVGAILAAGRMRASRRRRHSVEQLFWVVTLRPLAALAANERERRLRELAGRKLCHPIDGMRQFPLPLLRRRLAQVGQCQLEKLLAGGLLTYRVLLDEKRGLAT